MKRNEEGSGCREEDRVEDVGKNEKSKGAKRKAYFSVQSIGVIEGFTSAH